jgi:hypothetical protein
MSLEEDLLNDERENRRERAFIREQLSAELKEKFSDQQLQFIIDAIATYFVESGVLDGDEDEVDVDLEEIAAFVCKEAEEEGEGPFDPQDVFFVVQGDLDFQEQNA